MCRNENVSMKSEKKSVRVWIGRDSKLTWLLVFLCV